MTAFVLVHGSGQNAGCWSRVAALLDARGHTVAAPDLPKAAAGWTLEDHAAEIAAAVTHPDTVVVCHSFSGAFLPLVPAMRECGLLVFLAAVIPEPGKSVRAQLEEDPSMFNPAWLEAGARWFDESQAEDLARELLFHDCDDERTVAQALGTVELMDTRSLVTQPCPLATWPDVPAACVVATRDRTLAPDWCRRMSRRVPGVEPIDIDSGHCPQSTRPKQLAAILDRLAAR